MSRPDEQTLLNPYRAAAVRRGPGRATLTVAGALGVAGLCSGVAAADEIDLEGDLTFGFTTGIEFTMMDVEDTGYRSSTAFTGVPESPGSRFDDDMPFTVREDRDFGPFSADPAGNDTFRSPSNVNADIPLDSSTFAGTGATFVTEGAADPAPVVEVPATADQNTTAQNTVTNPGLTEISDTGTVFVGEAVASAAGGTGNTEGAGEENDHGDPDRLRDDPAGTVTPSGTVLVPLGDMDLTGLADQVDPTFRTAVEYLDSAEGRADRLSLGDQRMTDVTDATLPDALVGPARQLRDTALQIPGGTASRIADDLPEGELQQELAVDARVLAAQGGTNIDLRCYVVCEDGTSRVAGTIAMGPGTVDHQVLDEILADGEPERITQIRMDAFTDMPSFTGHDAMTAQAIDRFVNPGSDSRIEVSLATVDPLTGTMILGRPLDDSGRIGVTDVVGLTGGSVPETVRTFGSETSTTMLNLHGADTVIESSQAQQLRALTLDESEDRLSPNGQQRLDRMRGELQLDASQQLAELRQTLREQDTEPTAAQQRELARLEAQVGRRDPLTSTREPLPGADDAPDLRDVWENADFTDYLTEEYDRYRLGGGDITVSDITSSAYGLRPAGGGDEPWFGGFLDPNLVTAERPPPGGYLQFRAPEIEPGSVTEATPEERAANAAVREARKAEAYAAAGRTVPPPLTVQVAENLAAVLPEGSATLAELSEALQLASRDAGGLSPEERAARLRAIDPEVLRTARLLVAAHSANEGLGQPGASLAATEVLASRLALNGEIAPEGLDGVRRAVSGAEGQLDRAAQNARDLLAEPLPTSGSRRQQEVLSLYQELAGDTEAAFLLGKRALDEVSSLAVPPELDAVLNSAGRIARLVDGPAGPIDVRDALVRLEQIEAVLDATGNVVPGSTRPLAPANADERTAAREELDRRVGEYYRVREEFGSGSEQAVLQWAVVEEAAADAWLVAVDGDGPTTTAAAGQSLGRDNATNINAEVFLSTVVAPADALLTALDRPLTDDDRLTLTFQLLGYNMPGDRVETPSEPAATDAPRGRDADPGASSDSSGQSPRNDAVGGVVVAPPPEQRPSIEDVREMYPGPFGGGRQPDGAGLNVPAGRDAIPEFDPNGVEQGTVVVPTLADRQIPGYGSGDDLWNLVNPNGAGPRFTSPRDRESEGVVTATGPGPSAVQGTGAAATGTSVTRTTPTSGWLPALSTEQADAATAALVRTGTPVGAVQNPTTSTTSAGTVAARSDALLPGATRIGADGQVQTFTGNRQPLVGDQKGREGSATEYRAPDGSGAVVVRSPRTTANGVQITWEYQIGPVLSSNPAAGDVTSVQYLAPGASAAVTSATPVYMRVATTRQDNTGSGAAGEQVGYVERQPTGQRGTERLVILPNTVRVTNPDGSVTVTVSGSAPAGRDTPFLDRGQAQAFVVSADPAQAPPLVPFSSTYTIPAPSPVLTTDLGVAGTATADRPATRTPVDPVLGQISAGLSQVAGGIVDIARTTATDPVQGARQIQRISNGQAIPFGAGATVTPVRTEPSDMGARTRITFAGAGVAPVGHYNARNGRLELTYCETSGGCPSVVTDPAVVGTIDLSTTLQGISPGQNIPVGRQLIQNLVPTRGLRPAR